MARTPITLVEASSQGHIALVAGKIVASTKDVDANAAQISGAGSEQIIAAAFSQDGRLFATGNNGKTVAIYRTDTWATIRTLAVAKRATAITFDPTGAHLLIADKFGEVYRARTTPDATEKPTAGKDDADKPAAGKDAADKPTAGKDAADKPELLLGHVSIVCDVKMSLGPAPLVLTCDRDEKLRVSRYPNAYNIQSFGLGHTSFVTTIAAAQFAPGVALTGSGDGTVRLWDLASGRLVQTVNLEHLLRPYYEDGRVHTGANDFADRNAASRRYGVLRLRAVETQRAFVAVVERFPVVVVLPFADGPALGEPRVFDIPCQPTDVAVLNSHVVAAFAPPAAGVEGGGLAVALEFRGCDGLATDEALTTALNALPTLQVESVAPIPSIYVWGNKMYLDPPKEDDQEEDQV
ncbi:WD repeat-containing protein 4 [Coemansia erecta]|nr:WD repeat-containing protein 4 [Coemansia erecta]